MISYRVKALNLYIMQPYVALDFETANRYRTSACSVGLVKFGDDGEKTGEFYTLLRPGEQFGYFDPITVRIHGIHAEDVIDKPHWDEVNDVLLEFVDGLPIVAHNMPFDGSVINKLTEFYDTAVWTHERLCTLKLSRNLLKGHLPSFGLEPVYNYLYPYEEFDHHNALADAHACGKIFAYLQEEFGYDALCDVMAHGAKSQYSRQAYRKRKSDYSKDPRVDRSRHYKMPYISKKASILRGAHIAIVGTLSYASHSQLESLIVSLGGTVSSVISYRTTLVIIGAGTDDHLDEKIRKAYKLQHSGVPIALVNEDEFFRGLKEVAGEFS